MKGFKNVKAYIRSKGIVTTNVAVENGKITYIGDDDVEPIFSCDGVLLPGFVDEHIHGAGGADCCDGDEKSLCVVSKTLAKEGTTAFLATTMTQSKEYIFKALDSIGKATEKDMGGATILGAHLEGPFICSKFKGAQSERFILPPSVATFDEFNKVANGCIKEVTYAVENDDGAFTAHLKSKNILASVGHSNATYDDVQRAIKNGLSCVTHTFNAQSPLHHRTVGVVGEALCEDELFTEIICDTVHVSVPAMKLLVKNKPLDKIVLITDAIRAKGLGDGESELGGSKVFVRNGEARLADGTLAGSVLKMNVAIKNMVEKVGVPFTTAVDFASYNPCKNLGITDMGEIKVGNRANFTVLSDNYDVLATFVNGKQVY